MPNVKNATPLVDNETSKLRTKFIAILGLTPMFAAVKLTSTAAIEKWQQQKSFTEIVKTVLSQAEQISERKAAKEKAQAAARVVAASNLKKLKPALEALEKIEADGTVFSCIPATLQSSSRSLIQRAKDIAAQLESCVNGANDKEKKEVPDCTEVLSWPCMSGQLSKVVRNDENPMPCASNTTAKPDV